jgi:hypothetical protein
MRRESIAQATTGGAVSWGGTRGWVRLRPDVAVTVLGVRGKHWITKRVNNSMEGIEGNFNSLWFLQEGDF